MVMRGGSRLRIPRPGATAVKHLATVLYGSRGIRLAALASRHIVREGPAGLRRRRDPAFPVLVYHRVNDDGDPFFPSMPTEVFAHQMEYVAAAYRVLPLEELVALAQRGDLPRNALAITFDDGYHDTLTHAAPVLQRLGVPATVFLATGFIGTAEVPWFDRLALAFKLTRRRDALTTAWAPRLDLATADQRAEALRQTLVAVKRLRDEELRQTVDRLLESLGAPDVRSFKSLMLSWEDVHALVGLGWRIGAHTVNHPILSRVSRRRARDEIEGSRAMIESACGQPPTAFAYPNGTPADYTSAVTDLVRQAGFACAVTTRFGINTRATSPWELCRGRPWEHHLPTFALKLAWYGMAPVSAEPGSTRADSKAAGH
jgi:peptidoglycan/xylan/chitin deacetylase (PgdA/CDA1 family)